MTRLLTFLSGYGKVYLLCQLTEHPESRLWYSSSDVSVYQVSDNIEYTVGKTRKHALRHF